MLNTNATKRTWWGKLFGIFFGFLIAGPIGALFGLLVGNFFDRGLVEHFSKPFWFYYAEKNTKVQEVFFQSLFTLLGHIAKTDGRVTETSIEAARNIMTSMGLKSNQKKAAQNYFNQGKDKDFDLISALNTLQNALENKPQLIRLFIETEYQFIRQTGLTGKKLEIMNALLKCMRLAPLQQQRPFAEDFTWNSSRQQNYQQYNSSSRQQYQNYAYNQTTISDAYKLLGLQPTASQQEVKRAYRRLISKNHPDKLIAKGLPESAIKVANEKTQRIRKAYEQISENRGW